MKAAAFFALMDYAAKKGLKSFEDLNNFLKGGKSND